MSAPKTPKASEPIAPALTPNDELAAAEAQRDQLLDMVVEMREELDTLKAAQVGKAATAVAQTDEAARMDAELDELKAEFADYPLIQVFERRSLVGIDANTDIRLKGEVPLTADPHGQQRTWKLRWFNFAKEGRAQQAAAEGYLKVKWDELQDREAVVGLTTSTIDEFVRKGERGLEVLHKMPMKLYEYKKRRDAARQQGRLESASAMRDHMANSVASRVGAIGGNADRAGTFIAKTMTVELTPGQTERFTP